MKAICKTSRLIWAVPALGALFLTTCAVASSGEFYQSYPPAKVIAHLPLSGGATQLFLRQEGRTQYLYVQRPFQQGFTVIDVTKPGRPKVVPRVPLETRTVMGSGLMITKTPEHSATVNANGNPEDARAGGTVPESVHFLDVSDPAHPLTLQTSNGGTSVLADDARGLIYVANSKGIWILSHRQVLRRHQCSSSDAIAPIPNCN